MSSAFSVTFRCLIEKAHRVLYVTDLSQGSHFKMVFTASQAADYVPTETRLEHIGFGLVLGDDGKRLRSRSGDTFPLRDLLQLAVESARDVIERRHGPLTPSTSTSTSTMGQPGTTKWTPEKKAHLAHVIGIGAVKYADLSMNRESGYKFSLEKMLSFDGNTAPYMLYAYVRVQGIYRKAAEQSHTSRGEVPHQKPEVDVASTSGVSIVQILSSKEELTLSLHLIRFSEIIDDLSRNSYPHRVSSPSSSSSSSSSSSLSLCLSFSLCLSLSVSLCLCLSLDHLTL
jgi:arginyl-tRNA synthetase